MSARTIEIAEATGPLAEYAQQVDAGPIVVTENGRPIAVVVAIENADLETVSLSQDARFLALIERSRERQRVEGGISSDEVRQRLGLARRSD
jgi:prevent-host-death family protein